MNRLIISANSSGSGKTSITTAILKILIDRGLKVSTFKSGCDYIDGMYHSRITGGTSHNLDSCFSSENVLKYILCENSKNVDISIIEGVMGFYDGIGFTTKSSTYELSKLTNTPTILILDCHGMGASIGAVLKGFLSYREDNLIKGVIFNRISPNLYESSKNFALNMGIVPLGYIPKLKSDLLLESRHLGLITAEEVSNFDTKLSNLAEVISKTLDVPKLLEVSRCDSLDYVPINHIDGKRVKIAISKDVAFSFLYGDNIDFLKRSNCDIVYFSPLNDNQLPKNIDGLILCGGYPELYAKQLSKNLSMIESIRKAINSGIPYIAECGGFMYLQSNIIVDGIKYPMADIFHGDCFKTDRLNRFGYTRLIPKSKNLMFNEDLITHEFHYSDTTNNGLDYLAIKVSNNTSWKCVHGGKSFYAGYPHLYFYGNLQQINNFIKECLSFHENVRRIS
ncbi:MAG: cobyrinate a,c-diamide synthase [Oscillospiraceae bacterium]